MKTRKEAEARAMELFPPSSNTLHDHVQELKRDSFLQCWEEMQHNKQTCGFCVEPKEEQLGQCDQVNDQLLTVKQAESICLGFYNDILDHLESGLSTELFHGKIVFNKHLEKALK
jgi:hypothetical protein